MKYKLINLMRSAGLLRYMDAALFYKKMFRTWLHNREFARRDPDFATPPQDLAFDALHHADWRIYKESGILHAKVFAQIIEANVGRTGMDVLEWGCGPGRLIRHMPGLLGQRGARITGSDYNQRSVDWCTDNLPGIEFRKNGLLPPAPFPDGSFDVVYNYSVFTHLSEEVQISWAKEIMRLLRPGGLMVSTTHGRHYRYLLSDEEERRRFDEGRVVVQGGYKEGMKWFFAVHPEAFVREVLFRDFTDVREVPTRAEDWFMQDVWVGRKG